MPDEPFVANTKSSVENILKFPDELSKAPTLVNLNPVPFSSKRNRDPVKVDAFTTSASTLPNEPVEVDEPLMSPLEEIAPNNGFEVVVKCCPVL